MFRSKFCFPPCYIQTKISLILTQQCFTQGSALLVTQYSLFPASFFLQISYLLLAGTSAVFLGFRTVFLVLLTTGRVLSTSTLASSFSSLFPSFLFRGFCSLTLAWLVLLFPFLTISLASPSSLSPSCLFPFFSFLGGA